MSELIGHTRALALLRRMKESGRLGSALVIVGASGVGKRVLVETFLGPLRNNPNVMVIERALNDKDEVKKNIGIEQVRSLVARMSLGTFGGGRKIGIIDGAEYLSIDAANALLKTLEDPSGETLIVLLTTATTSIPATVLSRCQIIHLPLVSGVEIASALIERGADPEQANEISGFACGRPGIALQLFSDAEQLSRCRQERAQLSHLVTSSLPEKLGLLGAYAKADKGELEQMLDTWETALHAQGRHEILKRLMRARSAMRQNVNPTLALEHAFL